jgi:hypothetical protein
VNLENLNEWFMDKINKKVKEQHLQGKFTEQCKEFGFAKASYACIDYIYKEYEKYKEKYKNKKISKREYNKWLKLKRRAALAKTLKGWHKK